MNIDACRVALSKGVGDYRKAYSELGMHMNAHRHPRVLNEILQLLLEYQEWSISVYDPHVDSCCKWRSALVSDIGLFLRLIGRTGIEEMCRRAGVFLLKFSKVAGEISSCNEKSIVSQLLVGAAECGNIGLSETIMRWYNCLPYYMLRGGASGSSVEVCKRAIELEAIPTASDMRAAGKHGSYEVFRFIVEQLESQRDCESPEIVNPFPTNTSEIVRSICSGPDAMKKLEMLPALGYEGVHSHALRTSIVSGNFELYEWCKKRQPDPSAIVFFSELGQFCEQSVRAILDLNRNDLSMSELNRHAWTQSRYLDGQAPTRASTVRLTKSKSEKRIKVLRRYCSYLNKYDALRYSVLLQEAIKEKDPLLIERIVTWGKESLGPGDVDYAAFVKLIETLPQPMDVDTTH
jgi:hypothetical protein